MLMEHLKQIREQEENAEKVKRDGLAESKRIVNAATDAAAALVVKAKSEASDSYKATLAQASDEAQIHYHKTIDHARWECDMLLDNAEGKLDQAISVIIGEVVN